MSLPLLCVTNLHRKQLALLIKISTCADTANNFMYVVANKIPALSDGCLTLGVKFTAHTSLKTTIPNYKNFIFKWNGNVSTGHNVHVRYDTCPMHCRKYKYSVFVRSTDQKTIIEYTIEVGRHIFTGYYHIGFRVSIILPEDICRDHLCMMRIIIFKPRELIGAFSNPDYTNGINYGNVPYINQ